MKLWANQSKDKDEVTEQEANLSDRFPKAKNTISYLLNNKDSGKIKERSGKTKQK